MAAAALADQSFGCRDILSLSKGRKGEETRERRKSKRKRERERGEKQKKERERERERERAKKLPASDTGRS
jgi:hypothetical protein